MSEATPSFPHTSSQTQQGQQNLSFYFQSTGDRQNVEDTTGLMTVVYSPRKEANNDGLEQEEGEGAVIKL